jgi:hypothetical protein
MIIKVLGLAIVLTVVGVLASMGLVSSLRASGRDEAWTKRDTRWVVMQKEVTKYGVEVRVRMYINSVGQRTEKSAGADYVRIPTDHPDFYSVANAAIGDIITFVFDESVNRRSGLAFAMEDYLRFEVQSKAPQTKPTSTPLISPRSTAKATTLHRDVAFFFLPNNRPALAKTPPFC